MRCTSHFKTSQSFFHTHVLLHSCTVGCMLRHEPVMCSGLHRKTAQPAAAEGAATGATATGTDTLHHPLDDTPADGSRICRKVKIKEAILKTQKWLRMQHFAWRKNKVQQICKVSNFTDSARSGP